MHRTALALVALLALASPRAPLRAQGDGDPHVALALPAAAALRTEGPLVSSVGMLDDASIRDMLRNGFPARLHYRVELWSVGGWFNDLEGSTEWDVIVQYDPMTNSYRAARRVGSSVEFLGRFADLAAAEAAIARPFRAPITARRRGHRYYYSVSVDVETLSVTDLDEVERWLRGELRPAVRGHSNPATALTRGIRTLFVRLLGGEKRHYEHRSGTFVP